MILGSAPPYLGYGTLNFKLIPNTNPLTLWNMHHNSVTNVFYTAHLVTLMNLKKAVLSLDGEDSSIKHQI
jgi:hypothetical protein